jgi:hypothetical protein
MTEVSPLVRFLVRAVKAFRAGGLKRAPADRPPGEQKGAGDWESLGRDLGRAVRKFKDGGDSKS